MGTIITKPGGAQVGYRGFRYNLKSTVIPSVPPFPVPLSGEAVYTFIEDDYSGDFRGISISRYDADGNDLFHIISKINTNPITIRHSNGTYTILSGARTGNFTVYGNYVTVLVLDGVSGAPLAPESNSYINFDLTEAISPYSGYSMAGNLNGSSINVGTFYLGVGSSTAGSTVASRSFRAITPQRRATNCVITTAGVMTGSMSVRLVNEGAPVGFELILAAGTAAGTYEFVNNYNLLNTQSNLAVQIIQSTAASCGIQGFSFTLA
jgi:hypothetical protein